MYDNNLRYQPVIYPDGVVAIHETIIDKDDNIVSASYEAVKLEALSIGSLESLLRQVYRNLIKLKPMTEEELESAIYGVESNEFVDEDDTNIIDLVDYLAR